MKRPNILCIHSHDTGRYVQPYGHAIPTPNIQRLADQGVLFRHAFCGAPTCSPSRSAMLTGQSAHSCGMLGLVNRGFTMPYTSHHLAQVLRNSGYNCTLCGFQHEAPDPHTIGYERVLDVKSGGGTAPTAVSFIESGPQEPFFLTVGFTDTHRPFPPPDNAHDELYCAPPAPLPDAPETRRDMARFIASARRLDAGMGAVIAAVDKAALADSTLIICTTDHGIAFPGMKCNLTDHGISVMLIMRGPSGLSRGKVCDAMVSQLDVFPTVCELAEIEPPDWLEGKSLMPLIRGETSEINEEVFAEVTYHAAYEPQRAVRTKRWKYIRRYGDRRTPVLPNCDDGPSKTLLLQHGWRESIVPAEQLYDLLFDPNESHNLAGDPALLRVVEEMRGRLDRWMERTRDPLLSGPVSPPKGTHFNDPDGLSPGDPLADGAVTALLIPSNKGLTMPRQPNILVFFTDQQRWDTCGCYGQPLNTTPYLDRMAADGVRFENAFTCQPVCGPARACIQTGKYATETGNYRNEIALPLNERTMAHWLSDAGYEVGYIGKWHLASSPQEDYLRKPIPPQRRGGYKDYWLASDIFEFTSHGYDGYLFNADMQRVDFKGYRVDCLTDFALDYLRTRDRRRPFLLFLSFIEPHHQNDRKRYEGPEGSAERFKEFVIPGDLEGADGDWAMSYPDYLGCINNLDFNLGRIRKALAELGMADNTIILFTSDHGCHFRTRNREYKRSCHDASIRVPMVAVGPGFTGGNVVSDLVSLVDVAPTLLAAGGVEKPDHMHGRPIRQLADGTAKAWPKEVFVQISESQVARAVRTSRWKYGVEAPGLNGWQISASDEYVEQYLYDLDADPHERTNLVRAPELAPVREQLCAALKRHMIAAHEKEPVVRSCP